MKFPYAPLFAALALTVSARANAQPLLYVDDSAPAGGNGVAWATAFRDLQSALAIARANPAVKEIRVGQGLYLPDRGPGITLGDRLSTFQLVNAMTLRGGFAGFGAPDPDSRNVALFVTVLSGDLAGDDTPGFANISDNAYNVVTGSGMSTTAILDGFTIKGGNAGASFPHSSGGGICIDSGSPSIRNCTFTSNYATFGGGIFSTNGSPVITDCIFTGNHATSWGAGVGHESGSVKISQCTFNANSSEAWGGGVFADAGATSIVACAFLANTAVDGGAFNSIGGAQTLVNCKFLGNHASHQGGAVFSQVGTRAFTNCLFSGNSAADKGGGLMGPGMTLINCTLSRNTSGAQGGGLCADSPTLSNSILWSNTDTAGATQGSQITVQSGSAIVNRCCVQGLSGSLGGVGNISADPKFIDSDGVDNTIGTLDDNVRLLAHSPCIDAGDNTAVPADAFDLDSDSNTAERTPLDLDNGARFLDDPGSPNTGVGPAPIVDMGAFEFTGVSHPACLADLNGNGSVESGDLSLLLGGWGPAHSLADLNDDGVVNSTDLGLLLGGWGACH